MRRKTSLNYCIIEHATGGIYVDGISLAITNCIVRKSKQALLNHSAGLVLFNIKNKPNSQKQMLCYACQKNRLH